MSSDMGAFIHFIAPSCGLCHLLICFADQEIEGIEMAESQEDEERVDERTWQAEMAVEREELEFDAEVERVATKEKEPQRS